MGSAVPVYHVVEAIPLNTIFGKRWCLSQFVFSNLQANVTNMFSLWVRRVNRIKPEQSEYVQVEYSGLPAQWLSPPQGARVQSLVRELRSHMPCGEARITNKI